MSLDHEMRRSGFTSTDMAAVFGVDPHRDLHAVWAVKVGGLLPEPPTWRMQLGSYLEHAVIQIYADYIAKNGRKVEPLFDKTFRHPKYPNVLATPDALVGDDGGVDAKTAGWDQRHQWGPVIDEAPEKAQLQMVTCMEVTNRDRWDIALLSGDQFQVITMERDREFGEYVCSEAQRIWQEFFTTKDNPPPIGGSPTSAAWLKQQYPAHKQADLRIATDAEIEQLRRYGRLKARQKVLAAERKKLENWLKAAIQDREGLVWEGGRLTWRLANDAYTVNWEGLAELLLTRHVRLPDDSARDEEACDVLKAANSTKTKGVRRMYLRSDEDFGQDSEEEAADAA